MTIKASDIRGLIEAGIEGEQLVTVVEIMESKDEVPETTLSNPLPSGGERGGQ